MFVFLPLLSDSPSTLQAAESDSSYASDTTSTFPAVAIAMSSGLTAEDGCSNDCPCNCHRPSRDFQLVPGRLRPWLGQLNISRTLPAAFWPSLIPCDHHPCARAWRQVQSIKYTAPGWFAHVEASIRFQAFPIHFCI